MTNNYTINYSDETKGSITVIQQTEDTTTSLRLVGRNSPNYGSAIAENFLHLLENFASPLPPTSPTEGQLWYDTSDASNKKLMVNDSNAGAALWRPAGGVHKTDFEPTNKTLGDIWVDTQAQLLKIYNGSEWILIGPSFSSTNRTGSYPAKIESRDGNFYDVILMYLNDDVIEIIAKDAFTPIQIIDGFTNIVPGVNISSKTFSSRLPVMNGIADTAANLRQTFPTVENVSANNFLRTDKDQSINGILAINDNAGLRIGKTTSTFILEKFKDEAVILNSFDRGSITFKVDKDGVRNTIMVINGDNRRVGINTIAPENDLHVVGTAKISSQLIVSSTSTSAALSVAGRIQTSGITSNRSVEINSTTSILTSLTMGTPNDEANPRSIITPATTATYDIGSNQFPFRKIYARAVGTTGTSFVGSLVGPASRWASPVTFGMTGTVELVTPLSVDGSISTRIFDVRLRNQVITGQINTSTSQNGDLLLMYQQSTQALRSISKQAFLQELTVARVPTGTIVPYGGLLTGPAPTGWVWCDGFQYNISTPGYTDLYAVIGRNYTTSTVSSTFFQVPDLRNAIQSASTTTNGATISYIIKL